LIFALFFSSSTQDFDIHCIADSFWRACDGLLGPDKAFFNLRSNYGIEQTFACSTVAVKLTSIRLSKR
jgi:hypothetical protein